MKVTNPKIKISRFCLYGIILLSFIYLSSCGKEDPCELFDVTLNGTFQSSLTPETTVEFSGGSSGTTDTYVNGSLVSHCSYSIDDCETGHTLSSCNGVMDVSTIEIIDMDNIHIAGFLFVRTN